jgi:hypothetical protein
MRYQVTAPWMAEKLPHEFAVEHVFGLCISDTVDDLTYYCLYVNVVFVLTSPATTTCCGDEGFACHLRVGVPSQEVIIKECIGDLVGNLVRVPFGKRIRSK